MKSFFILLSILQECYGKDIVARIGGRNVAEKIGGARHRRQVLIRGSDEERRHKWFNNTVHYYFYEENFDFTVKESILRAMELISNHTCIKFSTEPSEKSIRMESDSTTIACYAEIGQVRENQLFSFNSDCYSAGVAVHELIHSLGFIHAHQRSDRDQYLEFKKNLDELNQTYQEQYKIWEYQEILVPYDVGSVMQYPNEEDEEYYPVRKYRTMANTMGSAIVAFYDYLMINKYYECSCANNLSCKNHGYPNPSNCSQCNCPYGFGGADCSQRAEPGATFQATETWQNVTISLDAGYRYLENNQKLPQVDFIYQFLWIMAPANKTTQIRVEKFVEGKCLPGCIRGGVEIKTNEDPRLTSPRLCCEETS
ncbi:Zinc metalloproteinase nas-22 [Caenorhabditis elegans]|uniref:Zinc metalloproteinase nas-22 n=1 Tax=Caenorhabditis elegans TaxID=6239 RepID=NAS22_CAEEL|nr:Zinc metalloproteinase nas-22 [Caenorhabditis elegans]Q22398.3 RecName: Full=Zinc metalloproteinase nas-22; AltName: Full=Nematode astacin 22; Flags: Precursor [Caenorhabditis elegans]CAA98530.2 Zinc metalloproteinase nas-22 [Caenorhabditis elegans]|eukprot:NP_505908.2 Zinc metalloproteinase nas-22 [Caenorhabditis elegans]